MVFDPAGRVLLIRCLVVRTNDNFVFWLTPGGEIEAGETPTEAAVRELREELGLEVQVVGPVYTEATQFEHQGEMRDNMDFVFTAQCAADTPVLRGLTADEIAIMKEIRWWAAEQIEAAISRGERIFPVDLVGRLQECRARRVGPALAGRIDALQFSQEDAHGAALDEDGEDH